MDQELRAYLEERDARMDERLARIDERLARMDERFDRVDERFVWMDERFDRVDERFDRVDERFVRVDERLERVETEARHTRVLMEGMDDKIRLLAEGVFGTSERIDSLREETTARLAEISGSVEVIHRMLVPQVQGLEKRLKILEEKAERENRDILDVIHEKFLRQGGS